MQMWRSTSTMPSARFIEAPVGQTSTQGGFSQCWHIIGSELVAPVSLLRSSTLRIHWAFCRSLDFTSLLPQPFSFPQAVTQASQPVAHLLVSISMPQRTLEEA